MNPAQIIGQSLVDWCAFDPTTRAVTLGLTAVGTFALADGLRRLLSPIGVAGIGAFTALGVGIWRAAGAL